MNTTLSQHSLTHTAWQARTVALVPVASLGLSGLEIRSGRVGGVERSLKPGFLGPQPKDANLRGCSALRPEDTGTWQEQKLL